MRTQRLNQPPELGKVSWFRAYDEATREAARSGRPLFLLFQEVPGCATCVSFGRELLSHPLLVDALEHEFVPVAIYNNVEGEDRRVLDLFGEPTWNNPVVRLTGADGADLVPRVENSLDPFALHQRIREGLLAAGRPVPRYLDVLGDELSILHGVSRVATFATPCFWSGETTLIQHPITLSTQAGWVDGEEVVQVHFDPTLGSVDELTSFAVEEGFRPMLGDVDFRSDDEPQFYLKKSPYSALPLGDAQRSLLNYAIPYNAAPLEYLSPTQRLLLESTADTGVSATRGTSSSSSSGSSDTYRRPIEQVWPWSLQRADV